MSNRTIQVGDEVWTVTSTGRNTQYTKDEFGVLFTSGLGKARVQRISRYSPRKTKSRSASLAELPEEELRMLFARSQPSWTSPELGYQR